MRPFRDEAGMTTVGMALALLLALALLFSAAQVWRVNSAATETQSVADAACLAAENEVAEFMIVAHACDAVVLSLSLASLAATGLGLVADCIPGGAGVGQTLLSAARSARQARDRFARTAQGALNRLQRALPFMAALNAATTASANDGPGNTYVAVALLNPLSVPDIAIDAGDAAEAAQDAVEGAADDIQQQANEAKEAMERASEAKRTAWLHDCGIAAEGSSPGYCMYERAATKAALPAAQNPLYRSVDTWSFSVALARARSYYAARLTNEAPENASVEEQVRSVMRRKMFAYAKALMATGYVHETSDSFSAYFPLLPKNTAEMRAVPELYDAPDYPITEKEVGGDDDEGAGEGEGGEGEGAVPETVRVMHAWDGCPEIETVTGRGSIRQMESGGFETCPTCGFTAASLGKVSAATSTIDNGFEYHYRIVAEQAALYEEAVKRAKPAKDAVKSKSKGLFETIRDALTEAAGKRIEVTPPGSNGAVALVVNVGSLAADTGFVSSFAASGGALSTRAAVSASVLVEDASSDDSSILTAFLDNVAGRVGPAGGVAGFALKCWSAVLTGYGNGQEALIGAVRDGLNGLPLLEETGLGTWAAERLTDAIEAVGLQPAELAALRPVVVNSAHVAGAGDTTFGARLVELKRQAVAHPLASLDLFASVIGSGESAALEGVDGLSAGFEIARVEMLGVEIPITIALPECVTGAATGAVRALADQLRGVVATVTGRRVWE